MQSANLKKKGLNSECANQYLYRLPLTMLLIQYILILRFFFFKKKKSFITPIVLFNFSGLFDIEWWTKPCISNSGLSPVWCKNPDLQTQLWVNEFTKAIDPHNDSKWTAVPPIDSEFVLYQNYWYSDTIWKTLYIWTHILINWQLASKYNLYSLSPISPLL